MNALAIEFLLSIRLLLSCLIKLVLLGRLNAVQSFGMGCFDTSFVSDTEFNKSFPLSCSTFKVIVQVNDELFSCSTRDGAI